MGRPGNQRRLAPLSRALDRDRERRQDQIRAIEARTGTRLVCYTGGPDAALCSGDVRGFVDLLDGVAPGADLYLMLQTPGGEVDQAERIVLLIRGRVGEGRFRVVVADSAKSAGTLVALGADEIVMGEPSELGFIDPQVEITEPDGTTYTRPARSVIDGVEDIVRRVGTAELPAAYRPIVAKIDPGLLDLCRCALERSETLAASLLESRMLRGRPDAPAVAAWIAHELVTLERRPSHGAVVTSTHALRLGLCVSVLPPEDPLWQALWSLSCEAAVALESASDRLFESRDVSLLLSAE
jgi:hypothetical protein